jgi:hypothetical protein
MTINDARSRIAHAGDSHWGRIAGLAQRVSHDPEELL